MELSAFCSSWQNGVDQISVRTGSRTKEECCDNVHYSESLFARSFR